MQAGEPGTITFEHSRLVNTVAESGNIDTTTYQVDLTGDSLTLRYPDSTGLELPKILRIIAFTPARSTAARRSRVKTDPQEYKGLLEAAYLVPRSENRCYSVPCPAD